MLERDYYKETIDRIEPEIAAIDARVFYASAAISLKRIADHLEKSAASKVSPIVIQDESGNAVTAEYLCDNAGNTPIYQVRKAYFFFK